MSVIEKFNGLNGAVLSREKLQKLQKNAVAEGQKQIAERIAVVLSKHDDEIFEIEIATPIPTPTPPPLPGLNAPKNQKAKLKKPIILADRFIKSLKAKDYSDFKKRVEYLEGYLDLEKKQENLRDKYTNAQDTENHKQAGVIEKEIEKLDKSLNTQVDQGAKFFGISKTDFITALNLYSEDRGQFKKIIVSDKVLITKPKPVKQVKKKATKTTPVGLNAPVEISTEVFKKMKVSELRKFTLEYYNKNLKGDKATIKKHLKEVVFTGKAGKKIAHGGAMYSEKAAAIEHLGELIKNSTYNNFGERKTSDTKDVLGYLHFKSKLTIDGIKRHLRVTLAVYKNRKTELKNVEIGKKKSGSHTTDGKVPNLQNGVHKPHSYSKNTKKIRKPKNRGLKQPRIDIVPDNPAPQTLLSDSGNNTVSATPVANDKVRNIAQGKTQKNTFFKINGETAKFLQRLERKPTHSVVITIDGEQGAGKTTTLYNFLNDFAIPGNKCLFASLEEHPDSTLAREKVEKFLDNRAIASIDTVGEFEDAEEFHDIIKGYEVVFIDSWQKLVRMIGNIHLDEDLRKKYDGKVFVIVFQQTTTGRTKGGADIVFDGDIIIKMVKELSFNENYAYFDKNRYTEVPLENLKYNIASATVVSSDTTEPQEEYADADFDIIKA